MQAPTFNTAEEAIHACNTEIAARQVDSSVWAGVYVLKNAPSGPYVYQIGKPDEIMADRELSWERLDGKWQVAVYLPPTRRYRVDR